MKLLLVRHGETEHNVACILYSPLLNHAFGLLTDFYRAGVTDSRLTNHGALQAQRLGKYLVSHVGLRFTHIFASDLQRAYMTADAILSAQLERWPGKQECNVVKLPGLREQDFGSLECTSWISRVDEKNRVGPEDESFVPKETGAAMKRRAEIFLNDYIVPLLSVEGEEEAHGGKGEGENVVSVVSHGLFLGMLWRELVGRFASSSVTFAAQLRNDVSERPLEYLPGWGNTAYLELDIFRAAQVSSMTQTHTPDSLQADVSNNSPATLRSGLVGWKMSVRTVNGREHLNGLKRTRGGVGSSTFDAKQKNLDGFFKKPKPTPLDES